MYYSQWSVYEDRNHFPRDIPYDYISNVFYCFIGIDEKTGNVKYMDENSDLEIEKIHSQQNLKISMSIGGWGLGDKFSVVMKNDKKFLRFIKSSIEMMTRHDFDGIDLDWEYPQNEEDAKKMVKLLKYLRYALNQIERITGKEPGSLLLSVASPCSLENLNAFHLKEMDNYLNFWNLMCYDFAGSWSQKVDYHSNLYSTRPDQNSVDKAVKHYISKGINSRKLILGMPNYGRSFTETSGYGESFKGVGKGSLDEEGIWNYNQLPLPRCKEEFDKKAVAAWNYDPENKTFISYDNAESARIKANYVVENSLGGGMWWESCGENYENIKRSTVHNFVDELYKNSPELF
ncbi:hypothetical protein PACTADRAFT_85288 [Pachysolen tannophilus NRRL Y-2460]|uniref:chitinase n=1 Tax=Pachysolen tannophilus NRRL Y-2460 TaxID=669874 RepID=A0A1E4TTZ0_PACTA|nr:hypothetical protein PACTADRAFT_85288 [Pachysolen tannophilus NRRL Y-2460]